MATTLINELAAAQEQAEMLGDRDTARLLERAAARVAELEALTRDVDANMRRAWADGSLSANAWPTALAARVAAAAPPQEQTP